MQLIELPVELLSSLPLYIRNIEDFTEFSSTCRTIYNAFSTTRPNTILRLAAASAPTFFHPHPHFLIMATAKQVSDWTRGNPERTEKLQAAFRGGVEGLFELCLSVAGLTLEDIRRLHLARFSTINPLSDAIDKMAGNQWYQTPDFWSGGVSEPNTIYTDAERATFQIIIYGELFGSCMDAYLNREPREVVFDLQVRLDYIKYCIPDWICKRGYPGLPGLAGLEVLEVGPYAPDQPDVTDGDQISLEHILRCARWKRLWAHVVSLDPPDFREEWKQRLWREAVQIQGLEGMGMVTAKDGSSFGKWTGRLAEIKEKIRRLGEKDAPIVTRIGNAETEVSVNVPDFHREVYVCMQGLWRDRVRLRSPYVSGSESGEDESSDD
ncbi:hypothetical protein V5O48_009539 [Marasmius crinis-equi]|uniref:F-box domain-containing protein n=1 Tax=Marasmius crinis-equi TaxID=585013 RepID=A0ABR3FAU0_9AGAR